MVSTVEKKVVRQKKVSLIGKSASEWNDVANSSELRPQCMDVVILYTHIETIVCTVIKCSSLT